MILENITVFHFKKAEYIISNGQDTVVLQVNYKDNDFTIYSENGVINDDFNNNIEAIAKDLLSRKSAVNFARR